MGRGQQWRLPAVVRASSFPRTVHALRSADCPAPCLQGAELMLGNAGTAMRPLTAAVAAAGRGRFVLDGVARMRERPIQVSFHAAARSASMRLLCSCCQPAAGPQEHQRTQPLHRRSGRQAHAPLALITAAFPAPCQRTRPPPPPSRSPTLSCRTWWMASPSWAWMPSAPWAPAAPP